MTKNDPGAVPGQSETLQAGCQGAAVQPDAATVEEVARTIYEAMVGRQIVCLRWEHQSQGWRQDYLAAARAVLAHAASADRPSQDRIAALEGQLAAQTGWWRRIRALEAAIRDCIAQCDWCSGEGTITDSLGERPCGACGPVRRLLAGTGAASAPRPPAEQDADTVRDWVESLDTEALRLFMRWVTMLWMQRNQIPDAEACPICQGRGQTVFMHGAPPPLGRGNRYVTCARCLGTGRREVPV